MIRIIFIISLLLFSNVSYSVSKHVKAVYEEHCASCHASNRLGGMGPALLPGNLKRLNKKKAVDVIANGRIVTQMPGYSEKITKKDIQALVDYVYTPLPYIPKWGMDEINKSHLIHYKPESLSNKPVFKADMLNLFIVVELGDHHATV
ncbi:MAG: cytochrome c, partial [Gammaproteobacteria bacterium]|nr:cytochrome c [Gammaproteobacteria bacterium]